MMRSAAFLLCALLIAPLAARAELSVGDRVPPVLEIAGKQVPLPQGDWIIAGRAPGTVTQDAQLGSYGTIWNLVLFRFAPGTSTLDAMAEINVNDMAVADGWGIAADCLRTDLALSVVRSRAGWDAACYFVTHSLWRWDTDMPEAWRQARRTAASRRLRLPAATVTAGFRVANRRDVIDVRYHFLAAFTGIVEPQAASWDASPWARDAVQQDRRRLAFDRSLAEWSAMIIGGVEAGLKNRLPPALAMPLPGAAQDELALNSVLHKREERLNYLRTSGLLSAEQFDQQAVLLRQAAAGASDNAIDPATEGYDRLLSYQGLSATSDAIVTFLWTAQSVPAAALTFLQASLRTGRTSLFAYLWDSYGGTPTRPDKARVVDFAYGGIDR